MKRVRRALYFQFAGLGIAAGVVFWLIRNYPVVRYVSEARHAVAAMGPWAVLLYPLLYALCNALLLPGGTLIAAGSGLFFGLWWGFAVNLTGSVLGATIAFTISRTVGRQWVRRKFLGHHKWAALDEAIGREGWKIILLSQLPPLFPTSLLQYLYGITRIRFRTCVLWVAIGQVPTLFLYTYLGTLTQHGIRVLAGESQPSSNDYVLWLGGLVLAATVATVLGRLALRLLAEAEAKVADAPRAGLSAENECSSMSAGFSAKPPSGGSHEAI
jgi:uncharacterized membrane protein YdjX (TVP38/TMEM64 family)